MGHRDKSYYRWRCMLTATPRTAISTKDASFDDFVSIFVCFMFSLRLERNGTSKMGLRKWDFKMGLETWCQKKRQWARNTLVFVSSRYANVFGVPEILHFEGFFFACLSHGEWVAVDHRRP